MPFEYQSIYYPRSNPICFFFDFTFEFLLWSLDGVFRLSLLRAWALLVPPIRILIILTVNLANLFSAAPLDKF